MWKALALWQLGWLGGLAAGYATIPQLNLILILMAGLACGPGGAILGAILAARELDEQSVLALGGPTTHYSLLGPTTQYSARESLIRSTPGVTMGCAALVSLPSVVAWILGLALPGHILLAATIGCWCSAWVCSGARKLPTGIVLVLTFWTLSGTVAVIHWGEEAATLSSYAISGLSMLVSVVLGLLLARSLILQAMAPTPKRKHSDPSLF